MLVARANFRTRRVHVTYQPGQVSREAMAAAIARVDLRLRARHWIHRLALWLGRGDRQ